jgi:hypothetical protein
MSMTGDRSLSHTRAIMEIRDLGTYCVLGLTSYERGKGWELRSTYTVFDIVH